MRPALGIDISNWQGPVTQQRIDCWVASGIQHIAVRGSLETPAKTNLAKQQLGALKDDGRISTSIYPWCYSDWSPEQTVEATEDNFAALVTTPWRWPDVEDMQYFAKTFGTPKFGTTIRLVPGIDIVVPHRLAAVDHTRPSLAGLSSVGERIDWLRRLFAELDRYSLKGGTYTGGWFWIPYLGNTTTFSDKPVWPAQYDGIADLSVFNTFGGWTAPLVAKQYQGSETGRLCGEAMDLDVFDMEAIMAAQTDGLDIEASRKRAIAIRDSAEIIVENLTPAATARRYSLKPPVPDAPPRSGIGIVDALKGINVPPWLVGTARGVAAAAAIAAIQFGVKDLGLIHLSPALQPLFDAEIPIITGLSVQIIALLDQWGKPAQNSAA